MLSAESFSAVGSLRDPRLPLSNANLQRASAHPHACAVSNCTTALHLALLAAGVGLGDEVITVSHSYIATANSVRYCGALPVFVDIDPRTYNMDPAQVEAAIGPQTRAILCVHQIGMPCDLASLVEIAKKHSLPLIEDAACAIGSEIFWNGSWEKIGKPHGDVACFSFHPRKILSTGDGGMITTRQQGLGFEVSPLAAALDVRLGYRPPFGKFRHLRELSGDWLQLSDDRRSGGYRAGTIEASASRSSLPVAKKRKSISPCSATLPVWDFRSSRPGREAIGRASV